MKTGLTVLLAAIGLMVSTFAAAAQEVARPSAGLQAIDNALPRALDATAAVRAMLLDPDFRSSAGLAENAYDFNAPSGIPGFGPIGSDSAERRVAQAAAD